VWGEERCERREGWREDSVCEKRVERVCLMGEERVCEVEGEEKEEKVVM
jgi:hypothetical protein